MSPLDNHPLLPAYGYHWSTSQPLPHDQDFPLYLFILISFNIWYIFFYTKEYFLDLLPLSLLPPCSKSSRCLLVYILYLQFLTSHPLLNPPQSLNPLLQSNFSWGHTDILTTKVKGSFRALIYLTPCLNLPAM